MPIDTIGIAATPSLAHFSLTDKHFLSTQFRLSCELTHNACELIHKQLLALNLPELPSYSFAHQVPYDPDRRAC
jgi:hypothetical protein